jgi:hypothetical protein
MVDEEGIDVTAVMGNKKKRKADDDAADGDAAAAAKPPKVRLMGAGCNFARLKYTCILVCVPV